VPALQDPRWQDRIEFLLDDKLAIKRLRFSELVQEQADEIEADDVATRSDVDFSIMVVELSGFFKALMNALGGENLNQPAELKKPGSDPGFPVTMVYQ